LPVEKAQGYEFSQKILSLVADSCKRRQIFDISYFLRKNSKVKKLKMSIPEISGIWRHPRV